MPFGPPINGDGIAKSLETKINQIGTSIRSGWNSFTSTVSGWFDSRGGFSLVGSGGNPMNVETRTHKPGDDITYIDGDAVKMMLTTLKMTGKTGGSKRNPNQVKTKKGENWATNINKGIKDAKRKEKQIKAAGMGYDLLTSDGSIKKSNSQEPDTTFTVKVAGDITTNISPSGNQVSSLGSLNSVSVTVPKSQVNNVVNAAKNSRVQQQQQMDEINQRKLDSLTNN